MSCYLKIETSLTDHVVVGAAATQCGFKVENASEDGSNQFNVRGDYSGENQMCCLVISKGNARLGFHRQENGTLGIVGRSDWGMRDVADRIIRASGVLGAVLKAQGQGFTLAKNMDLNPADINAQVEVVMQRTRAA